MGLLNATACMPEREPIFSLSRNMKEKYYPTLLLLPL